MGFDGRWGRMTMAALAFAATAVLIFFGNGLEPHWPLMWIAFVPVLWFALGSRVWQAGVVAFAAMLLGCLNFWLLRCAGRAARCVVHRLWPDRTDVCGWRAADARTGAARCDLERVDRAAGVVGDV